MRGRRPWLTCILVIALLGACTSVRLIDEYDEQIDRAVTEFQRKVETFLTRLERHPAAPQSRYEASADFYDDARVDLSAIRVRAAAMPKSEITLQQIDLLADSLGKLEELHKLGIRPEHVAPIRSAFNAMCTAILRLELAKKRGDSTDK